MQIAEIKNELLEFEGKAPISSLPMVSVIMPIRDEAKFIRKSLRAIIDQDYPAERFELIIADGMSTDGTRDIVKQFIKENPDYSISLMNNDKHIFPSGFNAALKRAKGDIVIMLGGHTEINRDYIRCCVEKLKNKEIDCVGGPIDTISNTLWGKAISRGMSSHFGVGGVRFRVGTQHPVEVDTVAFGAYRRSAIERCGWLDEELVRNQDDEYNYRLRKLGGKIFLCPDVRSTYYSRKSLTGLWRQYFQYGYWKVRVLQKHPKQMRWRQFVPPAFVAGLVGSILLAPCFSWARFLLILIAGFYIGANLLASVITCFRNGLKHLPILPIVFATLHLSYGSGFLVGLVRFANRWGNNSKRQ